jgi:hypothetical protein
MRVGAVVALVGIALLVGLGLALVANRPIPPSGAVSYVGRQDLAPAEWAWDVGMAGGLPAGAVVVDGTWAVRVDPDAPGSGAAVCEVAGGPTGIMPLDFLLIDKRFPLLALDAPTGPDLAIEVQFKLLSGNVDRAAGIAFRIRDEGNYYVVRANGLEANINLYKFVDGRRSIMREARAEIPSGVWQTLSVEAQGTSIRWGLDGRPLGQVDDTTYETGGIGLWTKADSISCFAGLRIRAL